MTPLEFPKAPQGASAIRLTVGKYKKAVVAIKDKDTLRGVSGVFQYGTIKSGRIFHPMGCEYEWNGHTVEETSNGKAND